MYFLKFIVTTFALCSGCLCSGNYLAAQCMLDHLSLAQRATQAPYILEGRVVAQYAFWDNEGAHIYTLNTIKLTKDFKGNYCSQQSSEAYLLYRGGTVGDITETVTPELSLHIGDIGLFFAQTADIDLPKNYTSSIIALQAYSGVQGFIAYDLSDQTAADTRQNYYNLGKDIYQALAQLLGKSYETIAPITPTAAKAEQVLPNITAISPTTVRAGMRDTITITGTDFGTYTGLSAVRFRNPDFYGLSVAYQNAPANHIVSWTDTQIRVVVPGSDIVGGTAGAGSGAIRIKNSSDATGESIDEITVLYNKNVAGFAAVNLGNDNTAGGYSFRYSTTISSNTAAKNAIQRALQTWRCAALINMITAATPTETTCAANDNINILSFDNNCTLPVGTLGQTTRWYSSCTNGDKYIIEIDMLFSTAVTWNYGPGATPAANKDFESIVVHELGHANGQGHVLDYGKLMYPSLVSGVDIRQIDDDALTCAHIALAHSAQNNGCTGGSYQPNTSACGTRARIKVFLQGPYNTTTGLMSTTLGSVIPTAQPFNRVPWLYTGTETFSALPTNTTDWVLVEARSTLNGAPIERRAALLRNDGTLLATDGTIGVPFTDLNPYMPYYIAIRHRNHLAAISKNAITLPNAAALDFTQAANIHGSNQVALMSNGKYALYSGDFIANGIINISDYNLYATQIGSAPNQYLDGDCNLDRNITIADFNQYRPNAAVIGVNEIRY
ncbi:MAG: IPT/TIG domain-containing protein [Chitinophagales bacterium]|nr:IPT/TIG domain-containing protein [Chitinophagales bacterium]